MPTTYPAVSSFGLVTLDRSARHANPTLMILALAFRVADKIKAEFSRLPMVSAQGAHY
jgi:hypothetical protein